jgi:hypothetical protein
MCKNQLRIAHPTIPTSAHWTTECPRDHQAELYDTAKAYIDSGGSFKQSAYYGAYNN